MTAERSEIPEEARSSWLADFAEAEDRNFRASVGRLAGTLDGLPLRLLDECSQLFDWAITQAKPAYLVDDAVRRIEAWAKSQGVEARAALELLEKATLLGHEESTLTADAQSATREFYQRAAVALQLHRLLRDFKFGIAEVLRLRVSASMGYLRLQAETSALLSVLARDDEVANAWWAAIGSESRSFYSKYHRKIRERVRSLDLDSEYERGSWAAQHSRPAGIIGGAMLGLRDLSGGGRPPGAIRLLYQEIDGTSELLRFVLMHLQTQRKVLTGIVGLVEELFAAAIDRSQLDPFGEHVEQLRRQLPAGN